MTGWALYLLRMGEIFDGIAFRIFSQKLFLFFLVGCRIFRCWSGIDHSSAKATCIRTDIYQIVGSSHDFFIVLYYHYRIAQFLQFSQYLDEAVGITTVQTDTWLIEDVNAAYER